MKLPEIGELNRRCRIYRRTDTSGDGGKRTSDWEHIATVWAKLEPLGAAYYESAQVGEQVTHRITIRSIRNITDPLHIDHGIELVIGGMSYRPSRITDENGAMRFTLIEATELGPFAEDDLG